MMKKTRITALSALFAAALLSGCAHTEKPIILDSDVSFKFGSAELTPEGRKQIDMYVPSLASRGEIRLEVVGHTDRIGDPKANVALSKRRAEAVSRELTRSGRIKPDQIKTRGVGSVSPVVQCNQANRQALIDCLAPNRRVEINVTDIRW